MLDPITSSETSRKMSLDWRVYVALHWCLTSLTGSQALLFSRPRSQVHTYSDSLQTKKKTVLTCNTKN